MESCCCVTPRQPDSRAGVSRAKLTATSMRSLATNSKLLMTFFSILTSCASFLARSGPKAPAVLPLRACPSAPVNTKKKKLVSSQTDLQRKNGPEKRKERAQCSPSPPLKKRPDLVVDGGGGGFWLREAMSARGSVSREVWCAGRVVPGFARRWAPSWRAWSTFDAW